MKFAGTGNTRVSKKALGTLAWSQNHRTLGVGRDLCGSPSPTPAEAGSTQSRLHSTASRWVLEGLQSRMLVNSRARDTQHLCPRTKENVTGKECKFFGGRIPSLICSHYLPLCCYQNQEWSRESTPCLIQTQLCAEVRFSRVKRLYIASGEQSVSRKHPDFDEDFSCNKTLYDTLGRWIILMIV